MTHTLAFAGACALLVSASLYAATDLPATPPAHAEFAPDGSVSAVHDGQYLNLALPQHSWTVEESQADEQTLTWPLFIHEVMVANLDYAAARYNVDMAVADAAAAKLLPNPTLSLGGTRDLTFHNKFGKDSDGKPTQGWREVYAEQTRQLKECEQKWHKLQTGDLAKLNDLARGSGLAGVIVPVK